EHHATKLSLSLRDIHALALAWAPPRARMERLLAAAEHWGPAHELGHALISTPAQRVRYLYGLQRCTCQQHAANECAAVCISATFLQTAGRADLIEAEGRWTPMLLETVEVGASGAAKLLATLGPIPETRNGLSRLLHQRLGRSAPRDSTPNDQGP